MAEEKATKKTAFGSPATNSRTLGGVADLLQGFGDPASLSFYN
jgi:hypothetical protein